MWRLSIISAIASMNTESWVPTATCVSVVASRHVQDGEHVIATLANRNRAGGAHEHKRRGVLRCDLAETNSVTFQSHSPPSLPRAPLRGAVSHEGAGGPIDASASAVRASDNVTSHPPPPVATVRVLLDGIHLHMQ